jgi:hypothetical protein
LLYEQHALLALSSEKALLAKAKRRLPGRTKHEQAPIVRQHKRKTGMERGWILKFIFDYVICIFLGNQLACYEGFN